MSEKICKQCFYFVLNYKKYIYIYISLDSDFAKYFDHANTARKKLQ